MRYKEMLDASIQSVCSHDTQCRTRLGVHVVVEQRYLAQPQPGGLLKALNQRGYDVTVHNPDSSALCIHQFSFDSTDVVVGRGRSWPVFAMLRAAELAGATVINSVAAITSVFDKARMAVELTAAGIATPRTWIGSPREISAAISKEQFPLVIKPVYGDNGAGISLVRTRDELISSGPSPVLAQHYMTNDGFDLKLYCIGTHISAVYKPCSVPCFSNGLHDRGAELVALTPEFERIANQCRLCFGLELFGVDCLVTDNGPVVIEVNEFPNYSAVPNASDLLAEYVARRAAVRS